MGSRRRDYTRAGSGPAHGWAALTSAPAFYKHARHYYDIPPPFPAHAPSNRRPSHALDTCVSRDADRGRLRASPPPPLSRSPDGRVTGVVRDSSGAAVPGATVTVTNDQTGASQSAVSGPDGTFSVTGLAPGDYTVEVQLRGFGTSKQKVKVTAGGVGAADFSLSARLEEEVVVTGTRGRAPHGDGVDGARSTCSRRRSSRA